MNEHKFAFILCTNNDIYLNECLLYLEQLLIPPNYETEIITIHDAKCMTAGYNEAMAATDAKYKIYMHQDVFIINRYFLYDILSIFESDASIGMIGMIGYPVVSRCGFMWREEAVGAVPLYGTKKAYSHLEPNAYRYQLTDGLYDAALIDGLMMVTSQDFPWDETSLQGWDFYDAFQSMNYLLHGYRVVVPHQNFPWFIHDDGHYLTMWNYEKYRKLFMNQYQEYLGKSCLEIRSKALT